MSKDFEITGRTGEKIVGIKLDEEKWLVKFIYKNGNGSCIMDNSELRELLLRMNFPDNDINRILETYH